MIPSGTQLLPRPHRSAYRGLGAVCIGAALACGGARGNAAPAAEPSVVAIVGGTIYASPDAAPIADGVLLISGERIVDVGPRSRVSVPADASVIDARGAVVLPAFWNSHVHFIEPHWQGVDTMPAARASELLRAMLSRWGVAHVVDIASFPEVTLPLRRRVAGGEVAGPDIRTTLAPFVPPNGTPRYLPGVTLPELHDATAARDSVRARVAQGADAIKLFTVPITRAWPFPVMAPDVVAAVTDEAHRAGRPVFAHPTNLAGIVAAVEGGVDVLAHTAAMTGPLPDSLMREMLAHGVALVPTLALWEDDFGPDTTGMGAFVRSGQAQLRAYAGAGGRILFGTDVGYTARYDPTREYELMAAAGLDFRAILATLTTAPADEFGRGGRTGRLAAGLDADVVVIDGDPARDIGALARVRLTMKRGRVIHDARDAGSAARRADPDSRPLRGLLRDDMVDGGLLRDDNVDVSARNTKATAPCSPCSP